MGFIVTPAGTFLEGAERESAAEVKADAEIVSFRNEIVTKVDELEKTVEAS
jgi:hypothetical protein